MYQLCDLVILPTAWEGFGLVAVEALLTRTPLFCTDLPVLREVTGNAAHYFGLDEDEDEIARRITEQLATLAIRARRAVWRYVDIERHYTRYLKPLLTGGPLSTGTASGL